MMDERNTKRIIERFEYEFLIVWDRMIYVVDKKCSNHICVSSKGHIGGDSFEIEDTNTAAGFPFSLSNIDLW